MLSAKARLSAWVRFNGQTLWKLMVPNAVAERSRVSWLLTDRRVKKHLPMAGYEVRSFLSRYYVLDGNAIVAILDLSSYRGIRTIDQVVVNPAYQQQGLGFLLHEYMLKKFKVLRSSDELSPGSSAVWARLITKYRGHIRVLIRDKPFEVLIHHFEKGRDGYVWPVVERDGKLTNLGTLPRRPALSPESQALDHFIYEASL